MVVVTLLKIIISIIILLNYEIVNLYITIVLYIIIIQSFFGLVVGLVVYPLIKHYINNDQLHYYRESRRMLECINGYKYKKYEINSFIKEIIS